MKRFKEFINESKIELEYPAIIPPTNKKECLDILEQDFKEELKEFGDKVSMTVGKDDKKMYKEDLEDGTFKKEMSKLSMLILRHEVIHYNQKKKYPEMFENTPTDDDFWEDAFKGDFNDNYKIYLSMPSEIMAYAFSWANGEKTLKMNMNIYEMYEKIGGKTFDIFKKYVDEYEKV